MYDCDIILKILFIGSCQEDKSKLLLNILDDKCDEDKFISTIGLISVRINN